MTRLELDAFLPYRLTVLANTVSRALARLYQQRFGLSIPEWRVIANLGSTSGLTALQIVERSAMDKVAVSRAVARLSARGLIEANGDAEDRRRRRLSLTAAGTAIYEEIVPLALGYEQALVKALDDESGFGDAVAKLQAQAEALLAVRR